MRNTEATAQQTISVACRHSIRALRDCCVCCTGGVSLTAAIALLLLELSGAGLSTCGGAAASRRWPRLLLRADLRGRCHGGGSLAALPPPAGRCLLLRGIRRAARRRGIRLLTTHSGASC
jgi:hypothetical protein